MNTRKQVLIMATLLMFMLIAVGIYGAWLPNRQTSAEADFQQAQAERGAIIFAQNCRLCHGDVGQGGAAGGRLPAAPALNRPTLQGFSDSKQTTTSDMVASATTVDVTDGSKFKAGALILIDNERMDVTAVSDNTLTVKRAVDRTTAESHLSGAAIQLFASATLTQNETLITNTITCGRVGTAMPTWSDQYGGPLNFEQIDQLMTLITQNRWDLVKAQDDHVDQLSPLTAAITPDDTTIHVKDSSHFTAKGYIRIGDERMTVTNIDKDGTTVEVERASLNTAAAEHAAGDMVYNFPAPPESPTIVQSACGQTAQAPAPAGTPSTVEPFTGQTVNVTAQNVQFDTKDITVNSGGKVRIRLDNKDDGVKHNIAVYKSQSDLTPVADGSVGVQFAGPGLDDVVFDVPAPGTYFFRCDVHPTIMFGTFTVK